MRKYSGVLKLTMSVSPMKSPSKSLKSPSKDGGTPGYKKYDRVTYGFDPIKRLLPSELARTSINISGEDYPMIIEFVNILDNTSQIHCTVDVDRPLFEPAPNIVVFEDYAPFAVHEKKLYFRNRDAVSFVSFRLLYHYSSNHHFHPIHLLMPIASYRLLEELKYTAQILNFLKYLHHVARMENFLNKLKLLPAWSLCLL